MKNIKYAVFLLLTEYNQYDMCTPWRELEEVINEGPWGYADGEGFPEIKDEHFVLVRREFCKDPNCGKKIMKLAFRWSDRSSSWLRFKDVVIIKKKDLFKGAD